MWRDSEGLLLSELVKFLRGKQSELAEHYFSGKIGVLRKLKGVCGLASVRSCC